MKKFKKFLAFFSVFFAITALFAYFSGIPFFVNLYLKKYSVSASFSGLSLKENRISADYIELRTEAGEKFLELSGIYLDYEMNPFRISSVSVESALPGENFFKYVQKFPKQQSTGGKMPKITVNQFLYKHNGNLVLVCSLDISDTVSAMIELSRFPVSAVNDAASGFISGTVEMKNQNLSSPLIHIVLTAGELTYENNRLTSAEINGDYIHGPAPAFSGKLVLKELSAAEYNAGFLDFNGSLKTGEIYSFDGSLKGSGIAFSGYSADKIDVLGTAEYGANIFFKGKAEAESLSAPDIFVKKSKFDGNVRYDTEKIFDAHLYAEEIKYHESTTGILELNCSLHGSSKFAVSGKLNAQKIRYDDFYFSGISGTISGSDIFGECEISLLSPNGTYVNGTRTHNFSEITASASITGNTLKIHDYSLKYGESGYQVNGFLRYERSNENITFKAVSDTIAIEDLPFDSGVRGIASVVFSGRYSDSFSADIAADSKKLSYENIILHNVSAHYSGDFISGTLRARAVRDIEQLEINGKLNADSCNLSIKSLNFNVSECYISSDPVIGGILDFEGTLSGNYNAIRLNGRGSVNKGVYNSYRDWYFVGDILYAHPEFSISDARIEKGNFVSGINGKINFEKQTISLQAEFDDTYINNMLAAADVSQDFPGSVDGKITLSGSFSNLGVNAELTGRRINEKIGDVAVSVAARIISTDNKKKILLENLNLNNKIKAQGKYGETLDFEISGTDFLENYLSFYPAALFGLQGKVDVSVKISGNPSKPSVQGNLHLAGISTGILTEGISISDGNADFSFNGLNQTEGTLVFLLNNQPVSGKCRVELDGLTPALIKCSLNSDNFLFNYKILKEFNAKTACVLSYTKENGFSVSAQADIRRAKIQLPDSPGGDSAPFNFPDITLTLRGNGNIWLSNKYFDTELKITTPLVIHMNGNDIKADGKIETIRGNIFVNDHKFIVETARAHFTADPYDPEIFVKSQTLISGITVFLNLSGKVSEIFTDDGFVFYSDPPKSNEEIMMLLATGSAQGGSGFSIGDIAKRQMLKFGFSKIESFAKSKFNLDVFRIDPKITSRLESTALSIGKYINRRTFVSATTLFDSGTSYKETSVKVEYNISKNLFMDFEQSVYENSYSSEQVGLKYKWKF